MNTGEAFMSSSDNGTRHQRLRMTGTCAVAFVIVATCAMNTLSDHYNMNTTIPEQKVEHAQQHGLATDVSMDALIFLVGGANADQHYNCSTGLSAIPDTLLPESETHTGMLIPRVIHLTGKSRCMNENLRSHIDTWRLQGHSLLFHDDDAVNRLLGSFRSLFPHLHEARKCITSGAGKADLWRYIAIWEYGGIYTDIDNLPGNFSDSSILPDDDAFFEQEVHGFPSQYFFAASRKHPLMYLSAQHALLRAMSLEDVGSQNVAFVTGPGAVKAGMINFRGGAGRKSGSYGYPAPGVYSGLENRTVRVVAPMVKRSVFSAEDKREAWQSMNMSDYASSSRANGLSCFHVMYSLRQDIGGK